MLEHYTRKSTPLGLEQPKYVQVIVPNNKNPSVLKNSEDNLETRDTLLCMYCN